MSAAPAVHTPGPWRVLADARATRPGRSFVWTERESTRDDRGGYTERCVATVHGQTYNASRSAQCALDAPHDITNEQAAANARLIAAAPELLALAGQYASECGECAGTRVTPDDQPCTECADICAVIDRAVQP